MNATIVAVLFASLSSDHCPLEPTASLSAIEIEAGFAIELVAHEPLVVDPVAISFDESGAMFVAEYRDYPLGPPKGQPPLSRVKRLTDSDGDGKMDKATIFADRIPFAQGVLAYRGGVLVTAAPDVFHFIDRDGDGVADQFLRLLTGFQPGNPQLRTAHPRWGLDNWIYLTNGLSGGKVTSAGPDPTIVTLDQCDVRFSPISGAIEPATGFGQFGATFDDWGNRFVCSNRNPVMFAVMPPASLKRNPFAILSKGFEDVSPPGGDAKVFPLISTVPTFVGHTGSHTAACGVWIHRGDGLGPDAAGDVFVCEPVGHLVTRSRLVADGVSFRAERARPSHDFLASRDPWFRPVSLADGPDGALYVVDMCRKVIEHPQYMPPGLAEKLDLRAGDDRGRIYRVRREGLTLRRFTPAAPTEWISLLDDPSGWRRQLGQRRIVEDARRDLAPDLEKLLRISPKPLTRLHALATLDGLGLATSAILQRGAEDPDPRVRDWALRIMAPRLSRDKSLHDVVIRSAGDASIRVRFAAALAMGEIHEPSATTALATIARRDVADKWIREAILSSSRDRSGELLSLLAKEGFAQPGTDAAREMVERLAASAAARGDNDDLARCLDLLGDKQPDWWAGSVIAGLADGLIATHKAGLPRSLDQFLAAPPPSLKDRVGAAKRRLDASAARAVDRSRAEPDRLAHVRLVGLRPVKESRPTLEKLLAPGESFPLQAACVAAISRRSEPAVVELLIATWPGLGPPARRLAIETLLRRPESIKRTFAAIEAGAIDAGAVPLDSRVSLLFHGDAAIKSAAEKLFGGPISADRTKLLETYRPAIERNGDATAGHAVYRRVCSGCHKLAGEGHEVGPDISDVRVKPPETLLGDILDPNRAVEPRWVAYTVAIKDGRVATGLIEQESAAGLVLRAAEGKREVVPRDQIETLRATGRSLMPEGVEKDITPQQMADLIAFLRRPASPSGR